MAGARTSAHEIPASALCSYKALAAFATSSRMVTSSDEPCASMEQYWAVPGSPMEGIGTASLCHDRPMSVLRSMPLSKPLT
jgi:hypothetical protein